MAKKEIEEKVADVSSDRQARWEAFLLKAKANNPVKFAQREKAGEFKVIPDSFK